MNTRALATMVLIGACGGAPEASVEPTPSRSEMEIAAFTLQAEGTTIEVAADGTVTVAGEAGGQLLPNGSFVNEGAVIMSLSGDTLLSANGSEVGTLSAEGTATIGDVSLRYDESGRLQGGGDGPAIVLTPADTPARRAAMLLTLVLTL